MLSESDSVMRLAHDGRLVIWDTTKGKADEVTARLCNQGVISRAPSDLGIQQGSEVLTVVVEQPVNKESDAPRNWDVEEGIEVIFDLMAGEPMMEVPLAGA